MHPGPGQRAQRATCSRPYIRRDTSRHLGELRSPGGSSPCAGAGAIDTALLWGDEGVPPISSGRLGLVLRGEELIWPPGAELGVWVCDPLEVLVSLKRRGMPSWELWGSTRWKRLLWSRWGETWRLWMRNLSVETNTGLPLDPMVGLRILQDS